MRGRGGIIWEWGEMNPQTIQPTHSPKIQLEILSFSLSLFSNLTDGDYTGDQHAKHNENPHTSHEDLKPRK